MGSRVISPLRRLKDPERYFEMTVIAKLLSSITAAVIFSASNVIPASAANPFSTMDGYWEGSGTAQLESGAKEKLRCKAYYNVKSDGSGLGMSLTCASPGSAIKMRATLTDSDGAVTGNWEERNFNATGEVSGKASSSSIRLNIDGTITGSLSISVSQKKQRVKMSASSGGLRGVNISLSR